MIRLALLASLAAYLGFWVIAALLAIPIAFTVGHRAAIRRTGSHMVRTGTRRVITGRF